MLKEGYEETDDVCNATLRLTDERLAADTFKADPPGNEKWFNEFGTFDPANPQGIGYPLMSATRHAFVHLIKHAVQLTKPAPRARPDVRWVV